MCGTSSLDRALQQWLSGPMAPPRGAASRSHRHSDRRRCSPRRVASRMWKHALNRSCAAPVNGSSSGTGTSISTRWPGRLANSSMTSPSPKHAWNVQECRPGCSGNGSGETTRSCSRSPGWSGHHADRARVRRIPARQLPSEGQLGRVSELHRTTTA